MIAILDYGLGNSISVKNMLKKVGVKSEITANLDKLEQADKLILPGVGHFEKGMGNLKKEGLDELIKGFAASGKPILGICLGAQLLTKHSEEGNVEGLELIPINTKKFIFPDSNLKVPNMGWSEIEIKQKHSYLSGFQTTPRFYFVHSYFMDAEQTDYVIAEARYGHQFAAVVANGNVVGMQFHPEKSHKFGMQVLKNFALK